MLSAYYIMQTAGYLHVTDAMLACTTYVYILHCELYNSADIYVFWTNIFSNVYSP